MEELLKQTEGTGVSGFEEFKHIEKRKEGEPKDFSPLIEQAQTCAPPEEIESGEIIDGRNYYTEFAEKLPHDTVILTAGCDKHRYNKLPLGEINGIPRVLDAGQCNDSYSLIKIALTLKEAFVLEDLNDLPIAYNIAWYEQKTIIVLPALLSLGVKNIHLGPILPALLSPNVVNVLVNNFCITGISNVHENMKIMLSS